MKGDIRPLDSSHTSRSFPNKVHPIIPVLADTSSHLRVLGSKSKAPEVPSILLWNAADVGPAGLRAKKSWLHVFGSFTHLVRYVPTYISMVPVIRRLEKASTPRGRNNIPGLPTMQSCTILP